MSLLMQHKWWFCPKCLDKVDSVDVGWDCICTKCSNLLELRFEEANSWQEAVLDLPGIWRYLRFLPLFSLNSLVSLGEGSAPPRRARRLEELLNVREVWLLPHSTNPTGTFKDLEAAFVISKCLESRLDNIFFHSTGNTARSYHCYASAAGLKSTSIIPLSCFYKMNGTHPNDSVHAFAFDGPFQEISSLSKKFASSNGMSHIAPVHWKLEGKSVMAYQIAEFLPDVTTICQTIAGGYGFLGMHLGFRRLSSARLWTARLPRFALIQIEDADSIATLYNVGHVSSVAPKDLKLTKSAFEPTLQSTNPMATYAAVREAAIATDSSFISVEKIEVEESYSELYSQCLEIGIPTSYEYEKSPFISWAGLRKLSRSGRLSADEKICLIITGAPNRLGSSPEPEAILKGDT